MSSEIQQDELLQDVVIRVDAVGKRYPRGRHPWQLIWHALRGSPVGGEDEGYTALASVSFEVRRGTTVGIIGRNGAGKSTLLQMLCGTLQPTSGSLHVEGRVAALLELGAGFNPDFTGRENVYLNASLYGLTRREVDGRMASIEAFAEIGEFIDQPVKTYSSGMFVRLAFAVLAHVDADVLIIDEALAVGDAYFTQKCMRFLHQFREHGTLLFVSHDTTAVMALCSYAVWLEAGKVREQGPAKGVCESYLAALFASEERSDDPAAQLHEPLPELPWHDQREPWLNTTPLRNDVEVFRFRTDALRFGAGAARIQNVSLLDDAGRALSWMVGGEQVSLEIRLQCHGMLRAPIVGFYIKDRLGQTLFGENTYLFARPGPLMGGSSILARFVFRLPYLPVGDYSLAVAVADGTPDDHVQHDWIHDALFLRSHASSVGTGLVGLPMQRVELLQLDPA